MFELLLPLLLAGSLAFFVANADDDDTSESTTPPDGNEEEETGETPDHETTEVELIERYGDVLPDWAGHRLLEDTVPNNGANDSLTGSDGDYYIIGGGGQDTLRGGSGDDVIDHDFAGPQGFHPRDDWYEDGDADQLFGGAGDDPLRTGSGDTVDGGEGADQINHFVDRAPVPQGNGFDDYSPLAVTGFASGQDQLNVTIDLESDAAEGDRYLPVADLRQMPDGTIELWASVTLFPDATHSGAGVEFVSPFRIAVLDPGSSIRLTDINLSVFWNEVS